MANDRLRTALADSSYDQQSLAEALRLDPKSVQRWITREVTPRRSAAHRAARLLGVPAAWLWPDLETDRLSASRAEIVTLYPHRADAPRQLWLDLLTGAAGRVWLFANASLFLPEENPESIEILRRKAENGTSVRILMADPDSAECAQRGVEERLFEAIPARVRMALTYYAPLAGAAGVEFRLQRTTLYNSIFVYDDQMLVNQHAYGVYGYMAPLLHLRRAEGGDFFAMYLASFERVWEISSPLEDSRFWEQRTAALRETATVTSAVPAGT
jgi:transcriptional regulator with XRE-family HTH domain